MKNTYMVESISVRTIILIETKTHREENKYINGIKYAVISDKSIQSLGKNQYTFNGELGSTTTKIKHWVKLFSSVKIIAMNTH
jgi:hypothetical protein